MRTTIFTLACWLVLAPIAAQKDVSAAQSKTRQPNILIILADDMGYGDVAILNRASRIPTLQPGPAGKRKPDFHRRPLLGILLRPLPLRPVDRPVYVAHPPGIGRQLGQLCRHPDRAGPNDARRFTPAERGISPDWSASGTRESIGSCAMKARGRSSGSIPTTRTFATSTSPHPS